MREPIPICRTKSFLPFRLDFLVLTKPRNRKSGAALSSIPQSGLIFFIPLIHIFMTG